MPKPKVFSAHPLFPAARKVLDDQFEVDYWNESERPTRAELLKRVADKEALICLLTEKVNDELLTAAPKLRIAATVSVGFDHIDVDACTRRKVVATHTPGVLDDTTADFAWALLMAIARRVLEGDTWLRSGTWPGWDLDQLVVAAGGPAPPAANAQPGTRADANATSLLNSVDLDVKSAA